MEHHDKYSFACFGTREGFEIFLESGLLLKNNKSLNERFYQFVQLESKIRKSISNTNSQIFVAHRFQDSRSNDFIIIGLYNHVLDSFKRDGYIGAAFIFKNCYPQLESLKDAFDMVIDFTIKQFRSKEKLQIEEIDLPVNPYTYDFSICVEDKRIIDILPSKDKFLAKVLYNHLGNKRSLYFTADLVLYKKLAESTISSADYDLLNQEMLDEWETKVFVEREKLDNLKETLTSLQEKNKTLTTQKENLEKKINSLLISNQKTEEFNKELLKQKSHYTNEINSQKITLENLKSEVENNKKLLNQFISQIDTYNSIIDEITKNMIESSEVLSRQNKVIKSFKINKK